MIRDSRAHFAVIVFAAICLVPSLCLAQSKGADVRVKAVARANAKPAWNKGLKQIDTASYYNAIECGKQGGDDPPCVFWDTGLCKNDDFALAFYSGYKEVAYQVWGAVRRKQEPPQPSYESARRTRVTVGVTPVRGSKNTFTNLVLKRGGKAVTPTDRSISGGAGRFTFDYASWSPAAAVTLELVGSARRVTCTISPEVLRTFR